MNIYLDSLQNQINSPSDDHLHVEINYLVVQPVQTGQGVDILYGNPDLVSVNESLKEVINSFHLKSNLVWLVSPLRDSSEPSGSQSSSLPSGRATRLAESHQTRRLSSHFHLTQPTI